MPPGSTDQHLLLNRFGAVCLPAKSIANKHVLVGGVVKDHLLPQDFEIIDCNFFQPRSLRGRAPGTAISHAIPRPLLVGHSATLTKNDEVVILGGGATCFSMGTCWNRGSYTFKTAIDESADALSYQRTIDILPIVANGQTPGTESRGMSSPVITGIPEVSLQSAEDFEKIMRKGYPVVLKKVELGSCVARWTLDYIVEKVGAERKVSRPYIFAKAIY